MPYRQTIPSDFMSHPRLAELARRMQAEAPPPAPQHDGRVVGGPRR